MGCNKLLSARSMLTIAFLGMWAAPICQAQIQELERYTTTGIVRALKPGQIEVELSDGKVELFKIQNVDEDALALGKAKYIVRLPAEISVSGELHHELLEKGMVLRMSGEFNRDGKMAAPVTRLELVDVPITEMIIDGAEQTTADQFRACQVTGRMINRQPLRILLFVQKSPLSRHERIYVDISSDAVFEVKAKNLGRVVPGDMIREMQVVKFSTGDQVIKTIDIAMTGKREKATLTFHDQLEQKHSNLSDEPAKPRTLKSNHFVLHTDISDRSAAILLDKLETMLDLIIRYYAAPRLKEPVECYVVRDLDQWRGVFPEFAYMKILEGAGVTATATARIPNSNRFLAKAVVYSCDNHGVCQHEAVHAICGQLFGSPGPTWYAEGMAEMGQYWRPNLLEVAIDPVVIDYLTTAKPMKLDEIIRPGQVTGDSWKAYAWRWALCHLLANNSNYAIDFKKLGIAMMRATDEDSIGFDTAFGKVRKEISFEYDQFVAGFGSGYRVDLCQWDWKTKFERISGTRRKKAEINSKAGWQATGLEIEEGKSYDFIAEGSWRIHTDGLELTADGDSQGRGKMIGAVLYMDNNEYALSDLIDLGEFGSFVAPLSGKLYVRCADDWKALADNEGTITVYFRLTPE
ncbi:MAG TPA: hypothetical protein PKD54_03235 [Pirellulaceae bacterium]|nr:hypothetical protein [Pirellulaceae bacterium]